MGNCCGLARHRVRPFVKLLAVAAWLFGTAGLLLSANNASAGEKPPDLIYLDAPDRPHDLTVGIGYSTLLREIIRQEFLFVAREEMGLRTRDASLREPKSVKLPETNVFQFTVLMRIPKNITVTIQRGPADKLETLWQKEYPLSMSGTNETSYFVDFAEQTLRKDFAEVLTKAGFKSRPARSCPENGRTGNLDCSRKAPDRRHRAP
jgi:hypothetical protein